MLRVGSIRIGARPVTWYLSLETIGKKTGTHITSVKNEDMASATHTLTSGEEVRIVPRYIGGALQQHQVDTALALLEGEGFLYTAVHDSQAIHSWCANYRCSWYPRNWDTRLESVLTGGRRWRGLKIFEAYGHSDIDSGYGNLALFCHGDVIKNVVDALSGSVSGDIARNRNRNIAKIDFKINRKGSIIDYESGTWWGHIFIEYNRDEKSAKIAFYDHPAYTIPLQRVALAGVLPVDVAGALAPVLRVLQG